MIKLNKQELVAAMADKAGTTRKAADEALDAFVAVLREALARGEKVSLVGFGTFEARERSARQGRNPQTGEAINIPASKAVGFRPGKELKDALH